MTTRCTSKPVPKTFQTCWSFYENHTKFSLNVSKYKTTNILSINEIQAVVLLLLFQSVSASCLEVFWFDFVHQLSSLHHFRCQNCPLPPSSLKSRLCSRQTSSNFVMFEDHKLCFYSSEVVLISSENRAIKYSRNLVRIG